MQKTTFISVAIFILMLSAITDARKSEHKAPVPVITSSVIKGEFSDQIEALGTLKANESVVITADRSEKVVAVHFQDGQKVREGDLLITLDKSQEEAELRALEAVTTERQNSYNRAKNLANSSALPEATLQTRLAALKQSQAETRAIKASLESYEIRAPFNGVLGLREVSVGTLIQPGDVITTIDDLSQIKVDFDVPSVFLQVLKPDLSIVGYVEAFPGKAFQGKVQAVSTQIDPVTRTVRVRAVLPNKNNILKPGLLMTISLAKNLRQSLIIPEQALVKRSDKNYVFLVVNDSQDSVTQKKLVGTQKKLVSTQKLVAKQTEVEIGSRQVGVVEVISGLAEGDQIISHGLIKIRDGTLISILAKENENEDTPLQDLLERNQRNNKK